MRNADLMRLEALGMVLPEVTDFFRAGAAHDFNFAMDAQPGLATVSNAGIPAFLANYIDPALVEVIFAPMKATEIVGDEQKKGDWTTLTAMFPVIELTGETTSYGDYNEDGSSGANANFPQRQSYFYQTITQWGDREMAMMGLAKISWVNQLNQASALVLNKLQNLIYFFGVSNLQNYGLMNDPNLPASISPTAAWSTLDGAGVYEDIRRLFAQLNTQCNGTIDDSAKMTLAMSNTLAPNLNKTNTYNVNVKDQLAKNFPNLTVKTAPEYHNPLGTGEFMQLILERGDDGQKTCTTAYTEKMRAHRVIPAVSSFKQKKSQGAWGTIIFRPFAIASMVGM